MTQMTNLEEARQLADSLLCGELSFPTAPTCNGIAKTLAHAFKELDAENVALHNKVYTLRQRAEAAEAQLRAPVASEVLDEIEEFLEQREDVRDGSDGPRPNEAMSLLMRLREFRQLARAKEPK